MLYRSLAATTGAAAMLAMTLASPAAANNFKGVCSKTAKNVTTCTQTYSELRLLSTDWLGDCVTAEGSAGRFMTDNYATAEVTETTVYRRHKVINFYVTWTLSNEYSVGPVCRAV